MTTEAMHVVVGGDWTRPLPSTRYAEPRPKPRGLDWSKHTAPKPETPAIVEQPEATVTDIRNHLTAGRALSSEQAAQIVADYLAGATIKGLCATYSRTSVTVYKALDQAGVPLRGSKGRPPTNTLTADKVAEIIRLYTEEQLPQAQVAEQVGVAVPTVARHLKAAGVTMTRRPTNPGGPRPPRRHTVDVDKAVRLYQEGHTLPSIATDNGWPLASLRRVIRNSGTPMRDDRKGHTGGRNAHENRRPEIVADIRRLYLEDHLSQQAVAAAVGVSLNTVVRIMRTHDIPSRERQSGVGDTLATYRARMDAAGITTADLRAWAVTNGHTVPQRGLMPVAVLDAYETAHPIQEGITA